MKNKIEDAKVFIKGFSKDNKHIRITVKLFAPLFQTKVGRKIISVQEQLNGWLSDNYDLIVSRNAEENGIEKVYSVRIAYDDVSNDRNTEPVKTLLKERLKTIENKSIVFYPTFGLSFPFQKHNYNRKIQKTN